LKIIGRFNGVAKPNLGHAPDPKNPSDWTYPPANYDFVGSYDPHLEGWTFIAQNDSDIPREKLIFNKGDLTPKAIFGGDFDFTIVSPDGKPRQHTSANDKYECVIRDFCTGFNHGFWGKYNSTREFNVKNQWASKYYNIYSQIIQQNSNSYGDAYSDNVGMNVHLNLNPAKVDTLTAVLLADNQAGGYNPKAAEGSTRITLQSNFVSASEDSIDDNPEDSTFNINPEPVMIF